MLALQAAAPTAKFISATDTMMDKMREVKDDEEIALMQEVAAITDVAMAETIKRMRVGHDRARRLARSGIPDPARGR